MHWYITGCYLLCGLSLWFSYKEKNLLASALKVFASLSFALLAWHLGLAESFPWFFSGLILCLMGDACLTAQNKGKAFLAGVICFLIAHLCYSMSFILLGLDFRLIFLLLLTTTPIFMLLKWLTKDLSGHLKHTVTCYIGVISIMVVLSWGIMGINNNAWWISMGATLFAASDVFVAINRFKKPALINRLIGLPLYYSAQILLILGFNKML